MRSKWLSLSALVLALGLVTAACSSNKTPSGGSPSSSASASASPSASSSGATGTITINGDVANNHGVKEVSKQADVGVNSFYFDPTIIKAAPGSKVTLKLTNVSDTLHNFSLTQQSVDQDIPSKGNATVTVTIPQSGELEFFCKYHKASGMVGALEPS